MRTGLGCIVCVLALAGVGRADTLELADGTVLRDCYVRDEGTQYVVWKSLADVGRPPTPYPFSAVKSVKIERGPDWDRRPALPDLSVTFIEITPKLAGLHGRVQYDELGRPWIGGDSKLLVDVGDRKYTDPEGAVKNLKLTWQPGEELTFTAHVKNLGFAPAQPFRYAWFIQPEGATAAPTPLETGECKQALGEMEEATFTLKWKWAPGRNLVTFRITSEQPEIAVINNAATDALWAWPFTFVVSRGRVAAWHENRSAYGTFSFEDFYRWHVDLMNQLFAASVFPAAPQGITARVRLDRIVYADRVQDNEPVIDGRRQTLVAADGIRYDQGGWIWNDSEEELKTGKWTQVDHQWRNQTEWSLPHELGHQLGLVDHYAIDYAGHEWHTWPDNDEKVTHFQRFPDQMMHSHGQQVYGEADAGYLNFTADKPRGHFGDYYFALPRKVTLRITDINGRGVVGATVQCFQRGMEVKGSQPAGEQDGVRWFDVVEDGNFDRPVSQAPVIVGQTGPDGRMVLPNRPVAEVKTLNGFHRQPNPFGNLNVVGGRGLMLVQVTHGSRAGYYWIEAHDLMVAWFRGQREAVEIVLAGPWGSEDSPPAPRAVQATRVDEHHAKITWTPPVTKERQYLERIIGYRVYARVSNDGLNDRPWFVVATLGPEAREFVADLRARPEDVYWFQPQTRRFGVTALGPCSVESELSEVILKE